MSWRKHRNKQKASSVRNIGVVGRGEGGDDFVSELLALRYLDLS